MVEEYPSTEEEGFVASGYGFFNVKRVQTDINFITSGNTTFKGWNYELGENFLDMGMTAAMDPDCDLKVWEEPKRGAQYVMGVDPAYGRNELADRSVISIWRCFADKLVQVAEYTTPMPETRQVAWVMAHLASEYRDVMINLEVSGPGGEVINQIKTLRQHLNFGTLKETAQRLKAEDCLDGAKWFLWNRPDTFSAGGNSIGWKTGFDNKAMIFNKFRDLYNGETAIPRSVGLLDEMKTLVQDGDSIAASGRNHDDRIFAACLAAYAWDTWRRPGLTAENRTYSREMANQNRIESTGKDHVLGHIVPNHFIKAAEERRSAYINSLDT